MGGGFPFVTILHSCDVLIQLRDFSVDFLLLEKQLLIAFYELGVFLFTLFPTAEVFLRDGASKIEESEHRKQKKEEVYDHGL